MILASPGERRRELAILRSLGAGPRHVFLLLASESLLLAALGCALGVGLLYGATVSLAPWLESRFGLVLSVGLLSAQEWALLAIVAAAGLLASLFPAWRAYRLSLADRMMVRV